MTDPHTNKKICILTGESLSRFGYISSYIAALKNLGYSVTVISADKEANTKQVSTDYGKVIYIGTKFVKLPIVHLPFRYISAALKEKDSDYFLALAPYPIIAAYILKKKGKKVIYWIGDDNASLFSESLFLVSPKLRFLKKLLNTIYTTLEHRICDNFDYIITLTESLKNDRSHYKAPIRPIYKCITPTFHDALEKAVVDEGIQSPFNNKKVIVYLGEISVSKGLRTMLEAFGNVVKEVPDSVLLLIGDFVNKYTSEEDRSYFDKYTNENGLQDKIIVTGWLYEDQIPAYLKRAHVGLVLLDAWCYSYEISVPDKLIDMLACGIPIISSDKLSEVKRILEISNSGLTTNINNVNSVSNSIIEILKDEARRRLMSDNGLQYCQSNHSLKQLEEGLRCVFREMESH